MTTSNRTKGEHQIIFSPYSVSTTDYNLGYFLDIDGDPAQHGDLLPLKSQFQHDNPSLIPMVNGVLDTSTAIFRPYSEAGGRAAYSWCLDIHYCPNTRYYPFPQGPIGIKGMRMFPNQHKLFLAWMRLVLGGDAPCLPVMKELGLLRNAGLNSLFQILGGGRFSSGCKHTADQYKDTQLFPGFFKPIDYTPTAINALINYLLRIPEEQAKRKVYKEPELETV